MVVVVDFDEQYCRVVDGERKELLPMHRYRDMKVKFSRYLTELPRYFLSSIGLNRSSGTFLQLKFTLTKIYSCMSTILTNRNCHMQG